MSKSEISDNLRAKLAGVFILTAYLMLLAEVTDSNVVTFTVDLLSGLSVIAIAYLLYPLFRPKHKYASWIYALSRYIEGSLMVLAGFLFLIGEESYRPNIYENIHIYAFIVGAAVLYYLIYQTKLVPRFIAIWGFIALFFLSLVTALGWFNVSSQTLDMTLVLMITNEIFLAIWLMTKGFSKSKEKTSQ